MTAAASNAKQTVVYTEKAVLDSLIPTGKWRTLFQCEDDAYAFVSLLARYIRREDAKESPSDRDMCVAFRIQGHTALIDWMPPGSTPGTFTQRDLACAFFGEAWCALVYDERSSARTLSELVELLRPPFLPGRLAIDVVQKVESLPTLE
jgi:hypothetical protein